MSISRLSMDEGGTFTDFVLVNEQGQVFLSKVPSNPETPAMPLAQGILELEKSSGSKPLKLEYLAYGTTVATNALLENKTARAGLITTKGFRDVLEIGRHTRRNLYDIFYSKPRQLIPRHLRKEVAERIDSQGQVLKALDLEELQMVVQDLLTEGVESLAICFLHSYREPAHEVQAKELVMRLSPGLHISVSHELCAEYREYERTSTVAVNACIAPEVSRRLSQLELSLADHNIRCILHVMNSAGGLESASVAKAIPVSTIESGPAAGLIFAAHIAQMADYENVISLDVGGTTAKVGLVEKGHPKITTEFEVGASVHGKSDGYPIKVPVVDIIEIGAGGGSVAWVDTSGVLKVGPQSAGAVPGPACYGFGGTQPTITDANVVLGRINTRNFLGGKLHLDENLAVKAIDKLIAEKLNLGLVEAAKGVLEVDNSNMLRALKLISVERGHHPVDFVLVAFGGAGPLHAVNLAAELGIETILIPAHPGVASAMGLLLSDIRHDFVQAHICPLEHIDTDEVMATIDRLKKRAQGILRSEGVGHDRMQIELMADLRYLNQAYEVSVRLPDIHLNNKAWMDAEESFHIAHQKLYDHSIRGAPVELVNLRVIGLGMMDRPEFTQLPMVTGARRNVQNAVKEHRAVYFRTMDGHTDCPIYDRYLLSPGHMIRGPAIIEQMDSTVVIEPEYVAEVDSFGNLIITTGA